LRATCAQNSAFLAHFGTDFDFAYHYPNGSTRGA
jgi:hypothetical protein